MTLTKTLYNYISNVKRFKIKTTLNIKEAKMKTYIKYFLFSVVLVSCRSEEEPSLISGYYWGEASAFKNSEKWLPLVIGVSSYDDDGSFSISLNDTLYNQGLWIESLFISSLTAEVGRFEIHLSSDESNKVDLLTASFITRLDDVLGDVYEVDESATNFVEILTYDSLSKEVSGRFEVTFILSDDNEWTLDSPDTIRFTGGVFHTRILDKLE